MSTKEKLKLTEIMLAVTTVFLIGLSFILMLSMSSTLVAKYGNDGIEWCFHAAFLCILMGTWMGVFTIIGRAFVCNDAIKEVIYISGIFPAFIPIPILWLLSIPLCLLWTGYLCFLAALIWKVFDEFRKEGEKHAPFEKFYTAQEGVYEEALAEISNGQKASHWMWFIFPQLDGLGQSYMSQYYALHNIQEARDYLSDPLLGSRLVEISEELLKLPGDKIEDVMDYPDNLKLQSCMTLFLFAGSEYTSVFQDVLDKYYCGESDWNTIKLLGLAEDQAIENWKGAGQKVC